MSLSGRNIAFRADASVRIGTGHVMRCLTLADGLREAGASCRFVMREHPGHLAELVQARGHSALLLPPGEGKNDDALPHSAWLGTDWRTDAAQTSAALAGAPVDLLVLDHYALDQRWQTGLADRTARWMVIDDLADRPILADVLLDQNLGTQAADYAPFASPGARLLIGPRYAPLRPEFAAAHDRIASAPAQTALRRILVAVSGTDPDNVSERLLDRLDSAPLPRDIAITVILGASAPHVAAVRARAARMPAPTQLLVGAGDMSQVFATADLCIGATGGMSWERCCVGLPTLLLILADNQVKAARALVQAGAGDMVGDVRAPGWETRFDAALDAALDPGRRAAMRYRALEVCDGRGTVRIVAALQDLWKV